MKPVIAYWQTRLLAQPIRLLLKYAGVDFEDKYYPRGPAPDYHKESFRTIKHTLDLDFPDLPYYMDDDVKLTQSNVILRYLARKHGLCGDTEGERCRAELVAEEIHEIREEFIDVCYFNPQKKEEYLSRNKPRLHKIQQFLGPRPFFAGDSVTYADFLVYEFLDEQRTLMKGSLDEYESLKAYLDRFEALTAIKEYITSDTFIKAPVNSLSAAINNV